MYNELLWIFTQLPDEYLVLDTETTGLPDEDGLPDIVTLGITVVRNRQIAESLEFKTRPQKKISEEAQSVHTITNEQAARFESFDSLWSRIADYLNNQLIQKLCTKTVDNHVDKARLTARERRIYDDFVRLFIKSSAFHM